MLKTRAWLRDRQRRSISTYQIWKSAWFVKLQQILGLSDSTWRSWVTPKSVLSCLSVEETQRTRTHGVNLSMWSSVSHTVKHGASTSESPSVFSSPLFLCFRFEVSGIETWQIIIRLAQRRSLSYHITLHFALSLSSPLSCLPPGSVSSPQQGFRSSTFHIHLFQPPSVRLLRYMYLTHT